MAKHSNLGPIDPWLRAFPHTSIKIIENENGVAYVKQVRAIATPAHAI